VSAEVRKPRVFMMDLLATVPYYTAYLSQALLRESAVELQVGTIDYYLDPQCFSSCGIKVDPGLLNVVGRFKLSKLPRRVLKLAESMVNLAALAVRFALSSPDVVHVQFLPMLRSKFPLDLWFVEMCQRRGAKIVLTVHDLMPHDTGEAHKAVYADLYRRVDAMICHSDSIRARLVAEFAVPEAKVSVIPHGPFFYDLPATGDDEVLREFGLAPGLREPVVDASIPSGAKAHHRLESPMAGLKCRPFKTGDVQQATDLHDASEGRGLMVLWQGIIFPYKGIDLLLTAWQQVEVECAEAWLVIAGTGAPELLEQIRAQVAALGLTRVALHFRFISTEELVALYRRADVVVYPYRAITTSGALATGLALGKTIVATDLPVFRELLRDGENARLVPAFDAEALAGALTGLLEDAPLREQMAGAVRAMRFGDESWLAIAQQTVAVYRGVVG
jgi:glycosyltransferase involved in cell wall biosynthesis